MICNFFEFKFIQFKNKDYCIKKSIDRDAFFVYILWHFVSKFLRALFPLEFFHLLVRLSKKFLKKSNFFLAPPKLSSRIFRKPSKLFRDFSDALEQFSISFELFQNLSENFSGCFRFFNLLQTFRANFQKAFRITPSKSKNI